VALRLYLTGRVCVEAGETLLADRRLGGRQERLAFVYLAVERARAATHDELAEVLWADRPPAAWERALSAVVSHLRGALARAGLPRSRVIDHAFGCYQLQLPSGAWVDVEAAAEAVDRAEGALAAGDVWGAYAWAGVATSVGRRPFLAGEDGPWVDAQRHRLRRILLRGLDCMADLFGRAGEWQRAVAAAEEAVALEPYRETGYRQLMRAHAGAGNGAEALRAYERCRRLLADELGVDPSPPTRAVYLELLRA
jgi:DNA-binding SARP family transcriptional activator